MGPLKFGFQNFFLFPDSKRLFLLYNQRLRRGSFKFSTFNFQLSAFPLVVGLTGLEPVTLRLSSACSNQLSYRPGSHLAPAGALVSRSRLFRFTSAITSFERRFGGGMGIRTPDL